MEMFIKSPKVSTGTCKTHKSYNEMNAFGYYLNALNSGAIYNFKLRGVK